MNFIPTIYSNSICPITSKLTVSKLFFYQLTGGKKYALVESEYQILTDPYDAQMVIFYQYLIYIIYRREVPCTPYHFKYVRNMLNLIEGKVKKKVKKQ